MTPWITIVVVAYQRYLHLPILIHSFLTQSEKNWKMVILHDGPDEKHQALVQPYLDQYDQIEYYQSEQRFNDWGHSLREWGISSFVNTPWTLITNDDNYYVPSFLKECHTVIKENNEVDFVMYDCLMNIPVNNSIAFSNYQVQYSFPQLNAIDMGSFIVKTPQIQTVGFRSKAFNADGVIVGDLLKRYPDMQMYKINQTLFVHN